MSYSGSSRSRGRGGAWRSPSARSAGYSGSRGFSRSSARFSRGPGLNPARYINKAVVELPEDTTPIKNTFADFGFDPRLQQSIAKHGYTIPTPIQDQTIPLIMAGKDVVGLAQTGTGKTAAFLLPLINKVLLDNALGVLIVVPTRELATQISDEFMSFARSLPVSKVVCVGGTSMDTQLRTLRRNPHFVIATPGRLKDLVKRHAIELQEFTTIVLDEVDRMLDIGFVNDIRFLIEQLPTERHSLFFSATMTREAENVMHSFCPHPEMVKIKSRDTSSQVDQDIVRLEPGKTKIEMLTSMLQKPEFERVIVFGRTKHGITRLEHVLSQEGLRVASIHGNKTQAARQRALDDFKRGRVQALLATDVAARGIDIDGVTHVINFDEPATFDDYVHRIGRTGRAGKLGKALTFVG